MDYRTAYRPRTMLAHSALHVSVVNAWMHRSLFTAALRCRRGQPPAPPWQSVSMFWLSTKYFVRSSACHKELPGTPANRKGWRCPQVIFFLQRSQGLTIRRCEKLLIVLGGYVHAAMRLGLLNRWPYLSDYTYRQRNPNIASTGRRCWVFRINLTRVWNDISTCEIIFAEGLVCVLLRN